jgi:predicted site-specific integrase-resolvase
VIEHCQSLSKWARQIGIARDTLKHWLAAEAILLPRVERGGKVLIRESDVERVVRKRLATADWSLLRRKTA